MRRLDLKKHPSVSETIDWAKALMILHAKSLAPELIKDTLNAFLKFEDDIDMVQSQLYDIAAKAEKGE